VSDAEYEAKLADQLRARQICAEQLIFEQSCHSVAEAAEAAKVTPEDFIKSIGCLSEDGRFVLAIVRGVDKVSATRVGKALGSPARIATPQEVLAHTGYPCGGTPPIGVEVACLVDPQVMEMAIIYGGGGSQRALLRMTPQEMVRGNGATLVRIRR
jgi:prolyl-tRNA editing enzyme YbaK/EbsC (Cys-tRNA(Pro) deacylase)